MHRSTHTTRRLTNVAAGLVLTASAAGPLDAQWTVVLDGSSTPPLVANVDGLRINGDNPVPAADVTLTVMCNTLDCTTVTAATQVVGGAASQVAPQSRTASSAQFTVSPNMFASGPGRVGSLQLSVGNSSVQVFQFAGASQTNITPTQNPANGSTGTTRSVPVAAILNQTCPAPTAPSNAYSTLEDRANFAITPFGRVISAPQSSIDEDDVVHVYLQVPRGLETAIIVRRTSTIRDVTTLNIAGGDVAVPDNFQFQAAGAEAVCEPIEAVLRDFGPGRGEVGIFVRTNQGEEKIGSFDFVVAPLYIGSFSLGPVRSWAPNRSFATTSDGTNDVVSVSNAGNKPVHYILMFTPYVWGKRDFEKSVAYWERINPTIGISLEDVGGSAFVGASIDLLNVIQFVWGVHVTEVVELDTSGGAEIGQPLPGGGTEVPTTTDWAAEQFFGATVDLRAAVSFFGKVFSRNAGS